MDKGKVVSLEERVPKLKQQRRKKANRRLILLLLLFFSLILTVVYFQSPLSRIHKIELIGNSVYSYDEIIVISKLDNKTNIWMVEDENIVNKLEKLPGIKDAKVQIKFPNTLTLTIVEYKRIAYIMNEKNYLPVLENGQVLNDEKTDEIPANAPILIGFKEGKALNGIITELETLPEEVLNSISEIHHTPKNTDSYHLTLYMNDGFEVSATIRSFSEKMAHYPSIVSQINLEQKGIGIIDLEVGSYFKPYEQKGADDSEAIEEKNESEG